MRKININIRKLEASLGRVEHYSLRGTSQDYSSMEEAYKMLRIADPTFEKTIERQEKSK